MAGLRHPGTRTAMLCDPGGGYRNGRGSHIAESRQASQVVPAVAGVICLLGVFGGFSGAGLFG
jgi:hypothetical protein